MKMTIQPVVFWVLLPDYMICEAGNQHCCDSQSQINACVQEKRRFISCKEYPCARQEQGCRNNWQAPHFSDVFSCKNAHKDRIRRVNSKKQCKSYAHSRIGIPESYGKPWQQEHYRRRSCKPKEKCFFPHDITLPVILSFALL